VDEVGLTFSVLWSGYLDIGIKAKGRGEKRDVEDGDRRKSGGKTATK